MISFKKLGTSLGTRHVGRIAKKKLDEAFTTDCETIVLDFEDVKLVTNSFADEVFGKKILEVGFDEFKLRTTFKNVNKFSEMCIKKAIVNRIKELDSELVSC